MKMKKLLAVVTAAVLTMATAMTAYAAPVASGGDVSKEDPDDDGLTPEEEEFLKKAATDKVSAVGGKRHFSCHHRPGLQQSG